MINCGGRAGVNDSGPNQVDLRIAWVKMTTSISRAIIS